MTVVPIELPFPYLDAQCSEARLGTISWEAFFENGALSADQMTIMKELSNRAAWPEIFAKDIEVYVTTCFKVLGDLDDRDVALVTLTIIYDIATKHEDRAQSVLKKCGPILLENLHGLVLSGDELVACHACRLLAVLAPLAGFLEPKTTDLLIEWSTCSLKAHIERETRALLASLLLQNLFRIASIRRRFLHSPEFLRSFLQALTKSRNTQMQYQLIMAVWVVSFDKQDAEQLQTSCNITTVLLDTAKAAHKEKILRVCVATWRNLLSKCPNMVVPVMVGSKLVEFLESFRNAKVADDDMSADINFLLEELDGVYLSLNSFDEYSSEIKSGKLTWSPPHKSELFWKDNAGRLIENGSELLHYLKKYLQPSLPPSIISIAANDIGMYILYHTSGQQNVESLGIKPKLMALLAHEDAEVRYHALSAMQSYMKKVWTPT